MHLHLYYNLLEFERSPRRRPQLSRKRFASMANFWAHVRGLPKPLRIVLMPILLPVAMWRLQLPILVTAAIGTTVVIVLKVLELVQVPWAVVWMCFAFPSLR